MPQTSILDNYYLNFLFTNLSSTLNIQYNNTVMNKIVSIVKNSDNKVQ